MRKLEVGIEYPTLEGKKVNVRNFRTFSTNDKKAVCSDGWWRFSEGDYVGCFAGEEGNPTFHHHIDWARFDLEHPVESVQLQLDLFNAD